LSTLTKVLIVLLTISSIFLCGIVVTYVANADHYKQMYERVRQQAQAAKQSEANWKRQLDEKIKQTDREKADLNRQIASLQNQLGELQTKLDETEREKDLLLQKVNSWASITQDFYKTNDKQAELLRNALAELKRVQAELIKERDELKQTSTALVEKMAIIKLLEDKNKQLVEEKTELQKQLDQLVQKYGKTVTAAKPVTQIKEKVAVAPPVKAIGLKGKITAVDPKNSLAEISLGAADGVKENMKFHVTRGDQFICDILILDVDADKAVGILDLVQQQPKVGDNVSTNL